jgi:hypothetical protein
MFKIQHQEKWVIMMRMENAKNFFLKTPIQSFNFSVFKVSSCAAQMESTQRN